MLHIYINPPMDLTPEEAAHLLIGRDPDRNELDWTGSGHTATRLDSPRFNAMLCCAADSHGVTSGVSRHRIASHQTLLLPTPHTSSVSRHPMFLVIGITKRSAPIQQSSQVPAAGKSIPDTLSLTPTHTAPSAPNQHSSLADASKSCQIRAALLDPPARHNLLAIAVLFVHAFG